MCSGEKYQWFLSRVLAFRRRTVISSVFFPSESALSSPVLGARARHGREREREREGGRATNSLLSVSSVRSSNSFPFCAHSASCIMSERDKSEGSTKIQTASSCKERAKGWDRKAMRGKMDKKTPMDLG